MINVIINIRITAFIIIITDAYVIANIAILIQIITIII